MSDIRIDRAVLTVKEDRPAKTSSPIGINALSPKEDAVFKREQDASRKLFSPIGSPMAENTAVANDGSFFSNKQAPHHIMGLFGGTSHQSSMFIRSLSPATNLGPNGKIDASSQAVAPINDSDEQTNEDIARSLPGLSPMNPMNHVNKINNAKRFEPPRRRAMSLVGTAGDRFANSDWSFDPNNFNNGQNIPYDHQVYSRSIEANNPWSNANVQQQEYYQYNNQQQYYNEQQYRAQQQQYYHMQQQAYQQQQQHHNYHQELSEQDEWITGMGGMDFENNNDSQPKYGQHVPGFYNASLMTYQHRTDTSSPQQSPRYAPGVTRVTNQMSNLTLNQGSHLSTSPNYSAQSPAPTTTSTTSCLVLGVGFRSGWMGPPTGPASRSLLIYNLPQGILFTAAHSYTAMSRSGYDPSTSTMTLTASTSSSTTPSSTPPTTPSSSTAQSPMMSPFSSPRMTSINAPMLNLSIVNAESLTPSSPFSLNASTSVADQLISLLLNFGPIRSLQFSAGNNKNGMQNNSPGSELFNNSPFLIVSYFDIRHAQNAVLHLHACNFKNKKLEVQYFFPKDYTSLKEQNQGTLVIFNLDPNTSNEDLKSIFGEYGEIKEIRESPNKKHKFIEFYDVRDAERAMKYLNKSEVKGKKIKIEPSRPGGPRKNMLHQLTLDVDDDLQTPHAVTPTSNSMPAPVPAPAPNYQLYQGNVHYPNYASNTAPNYPSVREPEVLKPYSPLPDKYSTPPPNSYAHHNSYHSSGLGPNASSLMAPSPTSGHVPAKPYTNHSTAPSNPLFFDGPGLFSLTPSISAAPNPSTEHVINPSLLTASPLDVFSSRDREFKPSSNTASPVKPAPSHATDGQPNQPNEHAPVPNKVKSDDRPIPSTRPRAHSTNAVMKSSPSLFDDLRPVQYNSDVNEDSALFDDTASTGSESQTASTGSNGSTTPVNGSAVPITRGRRRTHSGRMSRDEDVVRYELYVDKVLNGEDIRTTLMIKNIPNKYDQDMLLTTVDKKYRGLYDFFYLPIDFKNKCNVGYAFVNFIQPVTIAQFYEDFNNKKWEKFNSEKVCKIAYARIQGKNQLIEHFKNSSLMFEDPKCRPIIFAASLDGHTAGPQEPFPIGPNVRPRNRKDSGGRNYKYNNTSGASVTNNSSPLTGSSSTTSSSHHKKNSRDNSANSRPSNKDLSTDKEP
jgi:RNA recognition motif-containing protein